MVNGRLLASPDAQLSYAPFFFLAAIKFAEESPHPNPPPHGGGSAPCLGYGNRQARKNLRAFNMDGIAQLGCCRPPLPLAGEGWGGGTSAMCESDSRAQRERRTSPAPLTRFPAADYTNP